jgi:LmbE family N-acetylglucosaminyl deacetylase
MRDGRDTGTAAVTDVGTLLGVWAHPDDEAYLMAGLTITTRAAGQRVVIATATRGEDGTGDPVSWPPERLAAEREAETRASMAAVGVTEHRWLDHRDGTLHAVPHQQGVAQVRALLEEVRPDTIVTFGPDGMTGHSDHRTVSGWVTAAWNATGRAARLWYATLTPEFHAEWGTLNDEIGLWFTGSEPPTDAGEDLALAVHCAGDVLDRKFAALTAHRSQTAGLIAAVGAERYRRWWSTEYFIDARTARRAGKAA